MIFFYILVASAFAISTMAAWFSITGLAAIFSGAKIAIILMGSSLELGKLVCASWLYRFWSSAPRLIRGYFLTAVLVLSAITSLGIFGFLSRAHLDSTASYTESTVVATQLGQQIVALDARIRRDEQKLDQIDQVVGGLMENTRAINRTAQYRREQAAERKAIASRLAEAYTSRDSLQSVRNTKERESQTLSAEVGPLKYLAEAIAGTSDQSSMDQAVRWLIYAIMVVFDPLAILLVVAANMQLARLKPVASIHTDDPATWFTMETPPGALDTDSSAV